MGTETKYRVGLVVNMGPEVRWLRTEAENDPTDLKAFGAWKAEADHYNAKVAMSWVQVLAARYPSLFVVVQRVEVVHG